MHTGEAEMSPVVGCVFAPSAPSDNYVHSLKKITHLLLRKLFDIFVNNLCELLDRPIICLLLKQMGVIGPKALFCKLLAVFWLHYPEQIPAWAKCYSLLLDALAVHQTASASSVCLCGSQVYLLAVTALKAVVLVLFFSPSWHLVRTALRHCEVHRCWSLPETCV